MGGALPAAVLTCIPPRLNISVLSRASTVFPRRRYLIVNGDKEVVPFVHSAAQDVLHSAGRRVGSRKRTLLLFNRL